MYTSTIQGYGIHRNLMTKQALDLVHNFRDKAWLLPLATASGLGSGTPARGQTILLVLATKIVGSRLPLQSTICFELAIQIIVTLLPLQSASPRNELLRLVEINSTE